MFIRQTTREEAVRYIEDFLQDTGGRWDWDDFTSIPIKNDAELDAIRIQCSDLRVDYPPAPGQGGYCNDEGFAVLKSILADLRRKIAESDAPEHD
jgi:hypothetical protein